MLLMLMGKKKSEDFFESLKYKLGSKINFEIVDFSNESQYILFNKKLRWY